MMIAFENVKKEIIVDEFFIDKNRDILTKPVKLSRLPDFIVLIINPKSTPLHS